MESPGGRFLSNAFRNLPILACVVVLAIIAVPPSQAQTYTQSVVYNFTNNPDGDMPIAPLIQDDKGNLYGTTTFGGTSGSGIVFKINKAGKETILHSFTGAPDGAYPFAGLVRDDAGNLYGTTFSGGTGSCTMGCGTVFKVSKSGQEKVLYNFQNANDGSSPYSGLVRDDAGNLYGVAEKGGTLGGGVVFKLNKQGHETVLYNFSGGTDGLLPLGALLLDSAGTLYGTTEQGGDYGHGTVFKLTKKGKLTVLYSFTGADDGDAPVATLLMDATGNLFGMTSQGGTYNKGTVFKIGKSGKFTSLYTFTGGADGARPLSSLILDAKGQKLLGTTMQGGSGSGVVFSLSKTGKEKVLYAFTGGADGGFPVAALLLDNAGNLYSTAEMGGSASAGVVFKLTPKK